MKVIIRQTGSILFLLLVAIPFLFSILSVVKLTIIKIQVSENLQSEELKTITVAESNIKWIIPGKELLVNGNLFDVQSFKRKENNLEITGLFDKEEDIFQKHLISTLHQKPQGHTTNHSILTSLIFQPVYSEKNTFYKQDMDYVLFKKNHCAFTENLASLSADILIPPPKA